MRKVKRIAIIAITVCTLAMCMSISVFAATTKFSGELPKQQGDTEISTVRRAGSTQKYFTIHVVNLDNVTNAVCAWTEGDSTGLNYSNPYVQVQKGRTTNVKYDKHVPDIGENVVLNLDNPVYLDYAVSVSGNWTPN